MKKSQAETRLGLVPGESGKDCSGVNAVGQEVDCDKCRYSVCCIGGRYPSFCPVCELPDCPRKNISQAD